jgi:cob(I)alamin adenosyltransferase
MKIYTKSGDKGETSLIGGKRISKSDSRIHLYGSVDELNSHIGLLVSFMEEKTLKIEIGLLHKIQNVLFDLGSNLACEGNYREQFKLPQINPEIIAEIEQEMDKMDQELEPLKNFILPGGSVPAAQAHVCRTVCRRVERELIDFSIKDPNEVPPQSKQFLNRLSDFFFVFSRYVNMKADHKEVKWGSNE